MHRLVRAIGIAVVAVVAIPGPVDAAQLTAGERPDVSGPLVLVSRSCTSKAERAGGRIVARSRSCVRFYVFDPASETNTARNFGVAWLQSTVDAESGWCALSATSRLNVAGEADMLERTPGSRRTQEPRRVRARLRLERATSSPATISNAFRLYPRRLIARRIGEDAGSRLTWRGSTRRKLGWASGIELSWPAAQGPPSIASSLVYSIGRARTC